MGIVKAIYAEERKRFDDRPNFGEKHTIIWVKGVEIVHMEPAVDSPPIAFLKALQTFQHRKDRYGCTAVQIVCDDTSEVVHEFP